MKKDIGQAGSSSVAADNLQTPFLSVIIAVRNEERYISGTLRELQEQDYPPGQVEFLVCDGMSTDGTRKIVTQMAAQDKRIRLLDNPRLRSSSGRNVGFRAGRGDLFLVIDGHVEIGNRQLFRNVADCFSDSGADCLGRPQPLIAASDSPWALAIIDARRSLLGRNPASLIYSDYEGLAPAATNGAAYRRSVFSQIGYVDETFDACEDLEFNTRADLAGLRCFTSPKLTVKYFARDSVRALFIQQFRYGFGRFKYVTRHPSHLSVSQLAPPGLIMALAVTLLGPLLPNWLWMPALAAVIIYAVTVVSVSVGLAARLRRWRCFFRYLVVFPTIHLGVGAGFLVSLARAGRISTVDRPPLRKK
jgi:glycosyltransferase involved in cell wall biosynthesis